MEETASWEEKRLVKKAKVDSLKKQIETQDLILSDALDTATDAKKVVDRKVALETFKLTRKNLNELTEKLGIAEKELGIILVLKYIFTCLFYGFTFGDSRAFSKLFCKKLLVYGQ